MIDSLSISASFKGSMASTESRRQLILGAMIRVVGAKGYRDASVNDIIEAADTSRTTFYKHFEGKHDCFLAAYEMLADRIFDELVAKCDGEQAWMVRMTNGLTMIVERFADDPALARTATVEVGAAGADARRLHLQTITRFTEYLDAGRELADGEALPENISLMSAGAVSGLIFDEVLAGRAEQLPDHLPDLLFAMLVPYVGPQAAAAEMRRAADDHRGA